MIVLDACAIVDMARQTEEGLALQELMLRDEKAISCDIIRAEAASVFRKLTRTEGLSPAQAERYCAEALALVFFFQNTLDFTVYFLIAQIRLLIF